MKRIVLICLSLLVVVSLSLLIVIGAFVGISGLSRAASGLGVSMVTARAYLVTGNADTDDSGGQDFVCVICRNDDGSYNDVDIVAFSVGTNINYRQGCDSRFPTSITPFSVAAYDVNGPYTGGNEDTAGGAAFCESFTGTPPKSGGEDPSVPAPTCIDSVYIPEWAVGGMFIDNAVIHWMPSPDGATEHVIPAGNTARVIGLDASGVYAKIIWVCDTYWVPASTLGPNPNYPWNGAPLPAVVVD